MILYVFIVLVFPESKNLNNILSVFSVVSRRIWKAFTFGIHIILIREAFIKKKKV